MRKTEFEGQSYKFVMQDDCHSMMWLGYFLAARGYIVAAVNHHGDSIAEGSVLPQAFLLRAERARDLTCVVDKLLADPMFGEHIDTKRIGAAGHSSGGETVIAIAGGIFDGKHLGEFCNARPSSLTCQPRADILASLAKLDELKKTDPVVQESVSHEHDALKDPRIKGVLAMVPAVGEAYTRGALGGRCTHEHHCGPKRSRDSGGNKCAAVCKTDSRRRAHCFAGECQVHDIRQRMYCTREADVRRVQRRRGRGPCGGASLCGGSGLQIF
jgi:Prolyl oligopeptidase family